MSEKHRVTATTTKLLHTGTRGVLRVGRVCHGMPRVGLMFLHRDPTCSGLWKRWIGSTISVTRVKFPAQLRLWTPPVPAAKLQVTETMWHHGVATNNYFHCLFSQNKGVLRNSISLEDQATILLHFGENLWFGTLWMLVGHSVGRRSNRGNLLTQVTLSFGSNIPPNPHKLGEKQASGPKKGVFHLEFLAGRGGLAVCMPPHYKKKKKA